MLTKLQQIDFKHL